MTSEKKIQALLFHWGMESSGDHHAGIAEFAYRVESFHDDASDSVFLSARIVRQSLYGSLHSLGNIGSSALDEG